jgi:hypothetical protein
LGFLQIGVNSSAADTLPLPSLYVRTLRDLSPLSYPYPWSYPGSYPPSYPYP